MEDIDDAAGNRRIIVRELFTQKILAGFGLSENVHEFYIDIIRTKRHLAQEIDHPARADGIVYGSQDGDSHLSSPLHEMNMNAPI